jgi:NTP pyrophosphatase (non-canonical NTP hydrolase)
MTINELVKAAHDNAVAKGFYGEDGKGERNFGELIALVHSELSEALEAHRTGKDCKVDPNYYDNPDDWPYKELWKLNFLKDIKDTTADEIADTFIRLGDLCGYLGIDIDAHIRAKMAYNATREKLHGKKY